MATGTVETRNGQHRAVDLDHVDPVVLQVACTRLWNALPAELDVITERDVRRYGNVDNALTTHCSDLIATVAADHDLPATQLLAGWSARSSPTGARAARRARASGYRRNAARCSGHSKTATCCAASGGREVPGTNC